MAMYLPTDKKQTQIDICTFLEKLVENLEQIDRTMKPNMANEFHISNVIANNFS